MQIFGKTITFIPTAGAENAQIQARMDKYGAQDIISRLDSQEANAQEGAFYVARAAPAAGGTGVGAGVQNAFSDTANVSLIIQNGGSTKTIIPQFIKARCTVAGTSTASIEYGIEVDSTNRYSSGGTTLTGLPTNPSASSPATGAVVKVGGVTAAAAGTGRAWVDAGLIRNTIMVVNDLYVWDFAGMGSGGVPDTAGFPPATIARITIPCPSLALPPTASMLLHLVHPSNVTTAPSYEWEIGWIER